MFNRFLLLFFVIIPLFLNAQLFENEDPAAPSLGLITSLCEGIREKKDANCREGAIGFTDKDIFHLWERLLKLHPNEEGLLQAFNLYQAGRQDGFDKALDLLDKAWVKNQPKIFLLAQGASADLIQQKIAPFILPPSSSLNILLNAICQNFRVLTSLDHLTLAGFKILSIEPSSHIIIASHPHLPGYLFKLYLDNNPFQQADLPDWQRLVNRCEGAKNLRQLIKKKKLKYFSVPNKWLYSPPVFPNPPGTILQPVMLIAEDMQLASSAENLNAWKTLITTNHLDELYCILSHGYASAYVGPNIPYTKTGKFSCIDTEYVKRKVNLEQVLLFLSPEMQVYWKLLIKGGVNN